MRARLITSESDLAGLAPDWNRLWSQGSRPEVFGCFAWAKQFLTAYGCGRGIRCAVIEGASGEVRGILPLNEDEWGWVRFIGDPRSDYSDVLCEPEHAADVVPAALNAFEHSRRLRLHAIPEHSLLLRGLKAVTAGGYDVAVEQACPAIVFDERGETLAALMGKQSLRRHEKKVAKLGPIRLARISDRQEALASLPLLFDQHVRRWRAAGLPSIFEDEQSRMFFQGLVGDDDLWPMVDFRILYAGDRVVATHFGFLHDGRFIWYKPSFEPELANLGAGEVLLKYLFTALAGEGVREFDFTRGSESFKQRFANVSRINYVVTRPGVWEKIRASSRKTLAGWLEAGRQLYGSNGAGGAPI